MPKRSAAVLIRDGKILLMHRVKSGKEYFVFPGGLVEPEESPEEAAIREIEEEFGKSIRLVADPSAGPDQVQIRYR